MTGGYDPAAFARMAELEERSWWFRSRNRLIADTVRRYAPQADSVLEIGCGTGYTLLALKEALPHAALVATELFEDGLAIARERVPGVTFALADACALDYESEFALVAAFDVIEHIDDHLTALREMREALIEGGTLIVTVPQHPRLWSPADDHAHHVRRYTRRTLRSSLEAAGFSVVRMTSFVTTLLPLMVAARLRPQREFDPFAEFQLPPRLDRTLERVADLDRRLIGAGANLPAGGSLLAVARR